MTNLVAGRILPRMIILCLLSLQHALSTGEYVHQYRNIFFWPIIQIIRRSVQEMNPKSTENRFTQTMVILNYLTCHVNVICEVADVCGYIINGIINILSIYCVEFIKTTFFFQKLVAKSIARIISGWNLDIRQHVHYIMTFWCCFLFNRGHCNIMLHISAQFVDGINKALLRPAYQSSTYANNEAVLAVDGDIQSESHTANNDRHPWWKVHLAFPVCVTGIEVTNRQSRGKYKGNKRRICHTRHDTMSMDAMLA